MRLMSNKIVIRSTVTLSVEFTFYCTCARSLKLPRSRSLLQSILEKCYLVTSSGPAWLSIEYDILSNNRHSKLHAVIYCLFLLFPSKPRSTTYITVWANQLSCAYGEKSRATLLGRKVGKAYRNARNEIQVTVAKCLISLFAFASHPSCSNNW